MPLVRVKNVGQVGVVRDTSRHELPLNAWTDARNVRFLDNSVWGSYGYGEVYQVPAVVPYHLTPCNVGDERYWLYAGTSKIYAVTIDPAGNPVHTNLTRQSGGVDADYSAGPNEWTSTLLGGLPVLNNPNDYPQVWDLNPANRCQDLPAWPANTYARAMRSYRNFLVAMGITKSGVEYPYLVKWSHPADPGATPTSWDETDPTMDAGETDLAEGQDPIVDGLSLRDSFIIYKESSVWRMSYIGAPFVFQFQKILGTSGAMNRNCIVELDGVHFVFTGSDIILHDGQQAQSLLDGRARRDLFRRIDVDAVGRAFVFKQPFLQEVYVCFPGISDDWPTVALVWSAKTGTVSFRELPNATHGAHGPVDRSLYGTWSQDDDPWDSDVSLWDGPDFTPSRARCLIGSADGKLYMLDASAGQGGLPVVGYVERRGLSFDMPEGMKLVRGIRARVHGTDGAITVSVGGQTDPWSEPEWVDMEHRIGDQIACDCFVSGRYIAVKFASSSAYQWRLDSYDIDVEPAGMW